MATASISATDPEFCPQCGTILPVPGKDAQVECVRCGYSVALEAFYGLERVSVVAYNKPKTESELTHEEDVPLQEVPEGPKVYRKCRECGHGEMTFTTKQTRSADEGQTVFYCCLKCRAVETEYS